MLRFIIFLLVLFLILYLTDRLLDPEDEEEDSWVRLVRLSEEQVVQVPVLGWEEQEGGERKSACHFYSQDCFDVYRCGGQGRLKGLM